ncbi:MAG: hypothetical protein AAGH87_10565 [Pseudomonadota bacterium]
MIALAAAACNQAPADDDALIEVCRPAGVEAATLGIGEISIPHDLAIARVQYTGVTGEYAVAVRLSQDHAEALTQLTREQLNQPISISLDGVVLTAPVVRTPILDGRILISDNYTRYEASEIVARLSGPCPPATP